MIPSRADGEWAAAARATLPRGRDGRYLPLMGRQFLAEKRILTTKPDLAIRTGFRMPAKGIQIFRILRKCNCPKVCVTE